MTRTAIGGGVLGVVLGIAGINFTQWEWWLIFSTALIWHMWGRK